jgi:hypothetical protein
MTQLPLIQFNNFRATEGYRLSDGEVFVIRKGKPSDEVKPCEPLKNVLCYLFANKVAAPESVLKFVRDYGPVTDQGNDQGDPVREVIWHAEKMRDLFELMRQERRPKGVKDAPLIRMKGIPVIRMNTTIDWDSTTNSPRWVIRPQTLLDVLWLQCGQAITRDGQIQACALCGEWFETGRGTGRRSDATFCSDEHRVHYNSLKRSWGE